MGARGSIVAAASSALAVALVGACATSPSAAAPSASPPPASPPPLPAPPGASPPSLPAPPLAAPSATIAAWDALVQGGRVFVVAPGFDAVEAYDPASGRRLWRTALPEKTSGRHTLHALGAHPVLWAGGRSFTFDAATGALVRPPDDMPRNERCWLHRERGLCAIRCDCDVRVVDCATGLAIGATYERSYVELHDFDGTSSGGCWGPGGDVLGRAGTTGVLAIEDQARGAGRRGLTGPLAFVGVALPSGKELYRLAAAPLSSTVAPGPSGMSADGATCFAGDHGGQLLVWDCATGARLWDRPAIAAASGLPGHLVQTSASPRGLFRRAGDRAELLDERTGAVRWSRTIPVERLTLLAGAHTPDMLSLAQASDTTITELVWLGPDGREVATHPVRGSLHETDDGGVLVLGDDGLVAYDRAGRELARAAGPLPANVTVAADHLDVFGDELVVLDRALHTRLRVAGSAATAPGSTLAALAVYRWPPRGSSDPGQVLLYSLAP